MKEKTLPFVSVLIPVKNEQRYIAKTLDCLRSQSYPKDRYEIIVVDNGSSDYTVDIVKGRGVKCFLSYAKSIGLVRNQLADYAKGEILAYIDGDCTAGNDWIKESVGLLEDPEVGACGGYINAPDQENWLVYGWALKKDEQERTTNILATGAFFIKRKVFDEVSGFNESLKASEDTDISKRVLSLGYKLLLSPKASVVHWGYPKTIREFLKRQIWQTSDYWISRKPGIDAIFLATSLSFLCLVGFISLCLFGRHIDAILSGSIYLVVVLSLSFYRLYRSSEPNKIARIIPVFGVSFLYLLGRNMGFLISTVKLCGLRYMKH